MFSPKNFLHPLTIFFQPFLIKYKLHKKGIFSMESGTFMGISLMLRVKCYFILFGGLNFSCKYEV